MNLFSIITENPVIFWAVVCGLMLLIEALTMGLTTIWFAAGALVALIVSLFHVSFSIQTGAFFISSVLFLASTRKIFVQKLKTGSEKTNVDALIGEKAIVTTEIRPYQPGEVRIGGQQWTAVCDQDDKKLTAGTEVIVIRIEGVKAVVRPLEQEY